MAKLLLNTSFTTIKPFVYCLEKVRRTGTKQYRKRRPSTNQDVEASKFFMFLITVVAKCPRQSERNSQVCLSGHHNEITRTQEKKELHL